MMMRMLCGQTEGKGCCSLGAWPHPKAVSEEGQEAGQGGHPCLVEPRAEVTGQPWEEASQTPVRALSHMKALSFLISQSWGSAGVRAAGEGGSLCLKSSSKPQGDGRVREAPWPESSLGLSRWQTCRRRGAFRRVARLPRLGQGAEFTHPGFRPLFNLFLVLCVREKHEPGSRRGGRLQGHLGLFPARRRHEYLRGKIASWSVVVSQSRGIV